MLTRAAALAANGVRVAVLDRADTAGGSWRALEVMGFRNVEVGVHLLENRPTLYKFLSDELQIELRTGSPSENFGIFFGHRIGFALTRVLLHSLVAGKAFGTGRWDKAARIFTTAQRATRYSGSPFCYPSEGCSRITSALLSKIETSGGKIVFNTQLKKISVNTAANEVICETSGGAIHTRKIILGSRAHAPVDANGSRVPLEIDTTFCRSIVMHITGHKATDFRYVEVIGDMLVQRVRDVGVFAHPRPSNGEHLICVQLRNAQRLSDKYLAKILTDRLVYLRLFLPGATAINIYTDDYILETATNRSLNRLVEICGPCVEAVKTTDFADGYLTPKAAPPCPPRSPTTN